MNERSTRVYECVRACFVAYAPVYTSNVRWHLREGLNDSVEERLACFDEVVQVGVLRFLEVGALGHLDLHGIELKVGRLLYNVLNKWTNDR